MREKVLSICLFPKIMGSCIEENVECKEEKNYSVNKHFLSIF